jgi:hypothetical protein
MIETPSNSPSLTSQPSSATPPRREVLKLSELAADMARDLDGMFGLWKEADHCDKDDDR